MLAARVLLLIALLISSSTWAAPPRASATGRSSSAPAAAAAAEATPSARPQPTAEATASGAPQPRPVAALALDRTTPRQTVAGFTHWVSEGRLDVAIRYLDLRGMRWDRLTPEQAARQLHDVLVRRVGVHLEAISDIPEGMPDDGAEVERIATVELDGAPIAISLERVRLGSSSEWLFSRATVARIPELVRTTRTQSWIEPLLPESVRTAQMGPLWTWQWLGLLLALLLGYPLGYVLGAGLVSLLRRLAQRTPTSWDDAVVASSRRPLRFAAGWLSAGLLAKSMALPAHTASVVHFAVTTPLIVAVGWALIAAVRGVTEAYLHDLPDDREMNTRGLRTQVVLLRKLGSVAVGLVTLAIVLMQFDVVRDVGWSMLASAGVAGVALGIGAQKPLGAVIAGLQIAITQPIRLGDAIIFQGQWGEVEEIALTYVRIKLWDERRLVVPIEKFLTDPFENWSKPGTEMIGIVEIAVDPTTPIATLRAALEQLAADHPAHDGRECQLQVVDVNEHRALLRARVSTSEVGETFAMRCDLREQLMSYLQELDDGRYLPRQRWQAVGPAASEDGPAHT